MPLRGREASFLEALMAPGSIDLWWYTQAGGALKDLGMPVAAASLPLGRVMLHRY
jgi:hypothetical protein